MITKFSTVYAGHVDLSDVGQSATPANERRYPNEHLPKDVILEQLAWLGKDVMPEFAA